MSQQPAHHDNHHGEEPNFYRAKRGIMSWLFTVDHKRLGVMYLASVLLFFLVAGILAIFLRTELLTPAADYVSASTYNQLFTLHGAIMVFLFIIPATRGRWGTSSCR
jgi:cytochrome c oxidase subunit 1